MQLSSRTQSLCPLGNCVFLTSTGGHQEKDNVQLSSVSRPGCYVSRLCRGGEGACITSRDVLKAAWKGINVSVHNSVPILLPWNRVWKNLSGSLCSPFAKPRLQTAVSGSSPVSKTLPYQGFLGKLKPGALGTKQNHPQREAETKEDLNWPCLD